MKTFSLIIFVFLVAMSGTAQTRRALAPDFFAVQYAGSIGYVSGGIGYNVFKKKARATFQFGHVPKSVGGPLNIFSGRLLFIPRSFPINDKVTLNPFDVGLMISYHTGENFRSTWPDHQYPENYYWWKTAIRLHLNLQPGVTFKIREHTSFKACSLYLDVNTNELYMVSYFQNLKALSPMDIIKFGAGLRLHLD